MRRESLRSCALAVAMLGVLVNLPSKAFAQKQLPPGEGHRASAVEAMQLPKFCWGQYMDIKGPEYGINGCGPFMNHYCYALVEELRANKSFGKADFRKAYLLKAMDSTMYTIRGMEKYPTCWLRPHVESTRQRVGAALRVYGVK